MTDPTLQGIAAGIDLIEQKLGIEPGPPPATSITFAEAQLLLTTDKPSADQIASGANYATGIAEVNGVLVLQMAKVTPFGTQVWNVPIVG